MGGILLAEAAHSLKARSSGSQEGACAQHSHAYLVPKVSTAVKMSALKKDLWKDTLASRVASFVGVRANQQVPSTNPLSKMLFPSSSSDSAFFQDTRT